MKDCQKVLATAKAYHFIQHDKSMSVLQLLLKEMKQKSRRPEEQKFLKNKRKQKMCSMILLKSL